MLTGLLGKTDGQASVFDKDLFRDMSAVRQFMGVCPQHDVLFPNLTPEEHLDIFYDFKGGDPAIKQQEIQSLILDVSLKPDAKKNAGSLSGGNRRKLSVAISLCGGSKLVMLDEPTAGMDLSARRSLWDMLKNYKRDKIIILTTHYMDEADVLGDRIGIMAGGRILCLGSSLFLKNRYGSGYKLIMVKKLKTKNKKVMPFLQSIFGEVELLSEVASEITFKISPDKAYLFDSFFNEFDRVLDELDI
jgi:ATP-binding cassette subfamily A (ABC1) protein 3